ncbi:MAG: YbaK/EbsC family protein [Candidatus Izemoplasmatales bacterium]
MSIERVRQYFQKYQMEDRILEFEESSATVELAAIALGCEGKRIAKTLSFHVFDEVVLIVTAGDQKVDNQKYKSYFNTKAKMLSFEEAEPLIGHSVGGVCPFGVNPGVKVYLDISLKRFDTVFPACGSSNSAIELSISELDNYSNNLAWIDVCKTIETTF